MVETVGGRLLGCGRAVHHAMPTINCNTSNTRVFDPLTLRPLDQHLLAPHLIHGTVEQRNLVVLLLLTNLPLECVAPTGGYTLVIFRSRTQAISPVSVLTVNIDLTPPPRLLRASLTVPVAILMGAYSWNLTRDSRASYLTCFQPWLRPWRLSTPTDGPVT